MIVQRQMSDARVRAEATVADAAELDAVATREGWAEAMRLFRRLGANARYFTDQSTKIPLDVASGDAAAGMCIDYYGRFQAEAAALAGRPGRVGFVTARGETSINADPIALLRGAPHRELAIAFIEFVLSDDGQKLWSFRRGAPGGPERYALRRLPIVPHLYDHAFDGFRADPGREPLRGGARLRLPPRLDRAALRRARLRREGDVRRSRARAAGGLRGAGATPSSRPRRPRCSTTSPRSTTRRWRGRCGRRCSPRIRWTRRAGRCGWSPAFARNTGA